MLYLLEEGRAAEHLEQRGGARHVQLRRRGEALPHAHQLEHERGVAEGRRQAHDALDHLKVS